MAELTTLDDLLLEQLKDIYNAEKQLTKALPKMAKAANSPDLKKAFEDHLVQTEGHVSRLEEVFEALDESPKGKTCKAMQGLIEEGSEAIEEDAADYVKDASLIAAAQRIEHYEIAAYGTVRTFAESLGNDKAAKLLQQTLDEEGAADKLLTQLAVSGINEGAEQQESEDDSDNEEASGRGASSAKSGGNRRR